MKVNKNRHIDQNGNVFCDLNATVYAINAGENISFIQLDKYSESERDIFNKNCEKFGIDNKMYNYHVNHDESQQVWVYDEKYDEIDLLEFFLEKCSTEIEKERVRYEISLYEKYNMTRLLRCMIWLVHYMEEHNIFWGVGRGSSVSSYCLYLIGLHMVDSIKYELDVNEFLKY